MWSGHLQPHHELWSRPHPESVTPLAPSLLLVVAHAEGARLLIPSGLTLCFRLWIEDHNQKLPQYPGQLRGRDRRIWVVSAFFTFHHFTFHKYPP
jgi:hypothetical protein